MFNRKELKLKGKMDFLKNYWPMVVVTAFFTFISNENLLNFEYTVQAPGIEVPTLTVFFIEIPIQFRYALFIGLFVLLLTSLVSAFIINVIRVGIIRYYLLNVTEKPSFKEVFFVFNQRNEVFWNVVKVEFLTILSIFLWTLCFLIPGIIKMYEYYMVDYLLAENPMISKKEAWATSKAMMDGNKSDTFLLGLSFIGWNLLNLFTFGLLSIFYVGPYMNMTITHLYLTLKQNYNSKMYQDTTSYYNEDPNIMY